MDVNTPLFSIVKQFDDIINLVESLPSQYTLDLPPIPIDNINNVKDKELEALHHFFEHYLCLIGSCRCISNE